MALMNCPFCGQAVSDKADSCPKCGCIFHGGTFIHSETKRCEDCGTEYNKSIAFCPNCGCPNKNADINKTRKKYYIWWIIALAVIAVIVFFAVKGIKEEEYRNDISVVTIAMLEGATDAESAGNLIIKVWNNAIFRRSDPETDKYVKVNGAFVDDFNDALSNLFSDVDFVKKLDKIKSNINDVRTLMKKMNCPPRKYKETFAFLKKITRYIIK